MAKSLEVVLLAALSLLGGPGCASRKIEPWSDTAAVDQVVADSHLFAFDRQAQRYHLLAAEYRDKFGENALLIEAEEIAALAEELYILSEGQLAVEMIGQAIRLLEGRPSGEKTPH